MDVSNDDTKFKLEVDFSVPKPIYLSTKSRSWITTVRRRQNTCAVLSAHWENSGLEVSMARLGETILTP